MPKKIEKSEVCGALLTWGADSYCAMDVESGGSSRITYRQFRDAMMGADLIVSEPTIKSKWRMLASAGIIGADAERTVIYWDSLKLSCRPELLATIERYFNHEKNKNKKTHTEGAVA
jgi:hypothetical protein